MKGEAIKLTHAQLDLLKSLQYIKDEKQLKEIKSLLSFYFRKNLDEAISRKEIDSNFTSSIYQEWLDSQK